MGTEESPGVTGAGNADTRIRVGVGGWTFEPWRKNFYPKGLAHSKELNFASRQLTAIEINGTYYSTFKPDTFARWRGDTPDDFVFSIKANRFATNRRELATAGESIQRFLNSGIVELQDKLGPIVWQFMPTKQFNPPDFEAFLKLLPREVGGRQLQHVLDVRHESFTDPQFLPLARQFGCTPVHTDSEKFPAIVDSESELAYIRLMRATSDCPTGYPQGEIAKWAQGARAWTGKGPAKHVFVFFINGAKERAPAGACELIRQLA